MKQILGLVVVLLVLNACQSTGATKKSRSGDPASADYIATSPARVYIELAQAYSSAGQLSYATDNANKAVREDGRNPRAHAILAHVSRLGGDRATADSHFSRAISLSPNDPYVRTLNAANLCMNGNRSAADSEFNAAAVSPRNNQPWVTYGYAGLCYEQAGDYKTARSRLRTAYDLNPTSIQTIRALARVERKLGNAGAAKKLEQQL